MGDVMKPKRPKRERKEKEPKPPKESKPPKKRYRWGAQLRVYKTHARLILKAEPRPNTPEAFYAELAEEARANNVAKDHGMVTYFKIEITARRL